MAKGGGSTRTVNSSNASASRTSDSSKIKKGAEKIVRGSGHKSIRKVNNKEKRTPTALTQNIEQINKNLKVYDKTRLSEKIKMTSRASSILNNAPVSTIISTKDAEGYEVQYKKVYDHEKNNWLSSEDERVHSASDVAATIMKFSKTIKLDNKSKWFDNF